MAKTKVQEWDATPGNNTDIDGNNIAEGCSPGGINNAIREVMAHIKTALTGSDDGIVTGTAGTANNLAKWDANGDLIDGPAATGADVAYVSGTAGTSGNLVSWNVDGDAVDAGFAVDDDDTLAGGATAVPVHDNVVNYVASKWTRETETATTSGTSHTYTLTGTVRKITVMFDGVSLSGTTDIPGLRIGTGGASTTSGYTAGGGNAGSTTEQTTFFPLRRVALTAGSEAMSGFVELRHMGGNSWVLSGNTFNTGAQVNYLAGSVTLAGALNFLELFTETATDTFDAGAFNIEYEVE